MINGGRSPPTYTPFPSSYWVADMHANRLIRMNYSNRILAQTEVATAVPDPTFSPLEGNDEDYREERPDDGQSDGGGGGHEPPPMSIRAAADATPALSEVQTPKTRVEPMRIQVGTSMLKGASVISSAPSGGSLK